MYASGWRELAKRGNGCEEKLTEKGDLDEDLRLEVEEDVQEVLSVAS